jgi:SAM-dependent methyltransferase
VGDGDVVLDVGAGDGLVAFGALDRVGPEGRVIFADVSAPLLDHARQLAEEIGEGGRCSFLKCAAEHLAPVADASVDVVTTRSVLIYVEDKRRALAEFRRVLRPDGRISIWEPINRHMFPEPAGHFLGFDVASEGDLAARVIDIYAASPLPAMMGFDEHDLFALAEEVGFVELHLELRREAVARHAPRSWDSFLDSSPNPLAPTFGEAIARALTEEEAARFAAHLRPLVEDGRSIRRQTLAHVWAEAPAQLE